MGEAEQKQSTKSALLNSAADLFAQRGYDAVSTREIAERAGVNLALIQYHFGSKAKLFLETVHLLTEGSVDLVENLSSLPSKLDPDEAAVELSRFIRDFLHYLFRPDGCSACRLIYREVIAGGSNDKELFESVVNYIVSRHAAPLNERVAKLIAFIRPEFTAEEVRLATNSVLGQCSFYVTHRPFIERMEQKIIAQDYAAAVLAKHVCRFSMAGLGVKDLETILERAFLEK